jgi:lysozyme
MMKGYHMTPEGRQKLKGLLTQHESYRKFPYSDITGHLTVGIGRNLSDRGISLTEASYLLDDDIIYFYSRLSSLLHFFTQLDENRQIALVDMCFNLGVQGFLNFKNMILALESGDYERAAKEMLDSKWAEQVGARADTLSNIVRTGEL